MSQYKIDRREFIRLTALGGIVISSPLSAASQESIPKRIIPSTGERLPIIGLGTSDEFEDLPPEGGDRLKAVIRTLVDAGG